MPYLQDPHGMEKHQRGKTSTPMRQTDPQCNRMTCRAHQNNNRLLTHTNVNVNRYGLKPGRMSGINCDYNMQGPRPLQSDWMETKPLLFETPPELLRANDLSRPHTTKLVPELKCAQVACATTSPTRKLHNGPQGNTIVATKPQDNAENRLAKLPHRA